MEMMNYNKREKNSSKLGLFGFVLFSLVGTTMVFYMIKNEPKPIVLGEDMYIPVDSENVDNENTVDIYSEEQLQAITYKVVKTTDVKSDGNLKLNLSIPRIYIEDKEISEINDKILSKFTTRYNAVKEQSESFENKFTYKVTYNVYESMLNNKRVLSFTFYERIEDDLAGVDATYKLYGVTIDLATKQILAQDDVAPVILGVSYKNKIKSGVKEELITRKLFTADEYSYAMTGLEEFYVRDGRLHIMFNPFELGDNKDYIDIVI